jgi:tetratricopeptide (TPR) repeat protein
MSPDERELLGTLFALQGQSLLKRGDKSALKSFVLAAKAAPSNSRVFFEKGCAYASQHHNVRCLLAACNSFHKATYLEPLYFEAWLRWAITLTRLAELKGDMSHLHEAHEKFEMALRSTSDAMKTEMALLYWHWGCCWYRVAKYSGEALDLSQALEKYRKAASYGFNSLDFWREYGNALAEQSYLLGRDELFVEVADLFRCALKIDPDDFEAWLSLACSYSRLYECLADDSYFHEADSAYLRASELVDNNASLWISWGQLLLNSAKVKDDMNLFRESLAKFQKALEFESEDSYILSRLGEVYMYLGSNDESYVYLCCSQQSMVKSLEKDPSNFEAWYLYGRCLAEFGRYFGEEKYYRQAIEKYRHGYNLNKQYKLFLYGLAQSHFELSEMTGDETELRSSLKHYSSLAENNSTLPATFWIDWGVALMRYGENTRQKHYLEAALQKFEEAILLLGDELENNPQLMECLQNYACTLDFLGDMYEDPAYYEKAIQLLSHIVDINPEHYNAIYTRALVLAHLGEMTDDVDSLRRASDEFEKLIEKNPEDEMVWNEWGVTILNLANLVHDPIHMDESQALYAAAESKFLQAIALGNVYAFYNMVGCHSLVGSFTSAMHYLERARHSQALPSIDVIMHDDWLIDLRATDEFRLFVTKLLREQQHQLDEEEEF